MLKNKKIRSPEFPIINRDRKPGYLYYKLFARRLDKIDKLPTLEEIKMEYIQYLLEITGNDLNETADILAISPPLLNKQLQRKGINVFSI